MDGILKNIVRRNFRWGPKFLEPIKDITIMVWNIRSCLRFLFARLYQVMFLTFLLFLCACAFTFLCVCVCLFSQKLMSPNPVKRLTRHVEGRRFRYYSARMVFRHGFPTLTLMNWSKRRLKPHGSQNPRTKAWLLKKTRLGGLLVRRTGWRGLRKYGGLAQQFRLILVYVFKLVITLLIV
jgi:hypothetical protein